MFSNKAIYDFTKQLLAWSAIVMLFVQPLSLVGSGCQCGSSDSETVNARSCCTAEVATKIEADTCCASVQTSCCTTQKSSPCRCGDQCRCSADEPGNPLPAVPMNDSHSDQVLALAISLSVASFDAIVPDAEFGRRTSVAHRPALTAQETCVLLSRFNC